MDGTIVQSGFSVFAWWVILFQTALLTKLLSHASSTKPPFIALGKQQIPKILSWDLHKLDKQKSGYPYPLYAKVIIQTTA